MASPLYALHKDANGKVLNASSSNYSFELSSWLRALDIRAGDKVEFEALAVRPKETTEEATEEAIEEEAPASLVPA